MKDDSYSLLRGGPAYRLTRAAGLHRRGVPTAAVIAMGLLLIVLAPMIAATAVDGTLFGNRVRIPLLLDYTIGARFLIAMPLLVWCLLARHPDCIRDCRSGAHVAGGTDHDVNR